MTRWARVRRVAVQVLLAFALTGLAVASFAQEISVNSRTATARATVTSVREHARDRIMGVREVRVTFATPEGPVADEVTAYGYGALPRPGETFEVEYDRDHADRVRRAGDHGDVVAGAIAVLGLVTQAGWLVRARASRRRVAGLPA